MPVRSRSGLPRRKCICGHSECRPTTEDFYSGGILARGRYFRVPSVTEVKAGHRGSEARTYKAKRRQRTFTLLKGGDTDDGKTHYFSAIHLNPAFAELIKTNQQLPHTVSSLIKNNLSTPWPHDPSDDLGGGAVLCVPNYPWSSVVADRAELTENDEHQARRKLNVAANRTRRKSTGDVKEALASLGPAEAAELLSADHAASDEAIALKATVAGLRSQVRSLKRRLKTSERVASLALSGQTRATLTSIEWHRKNLRAVREFYGGQFRTFDLMLQYFAVYFPTVKVERSDASKGEHLRDFERLCLAVMFLKTGRNEGDLAYAWGVTFQATTAALHRFVPIIGAVGRRWSRRLLSYEFVKKSQPEQYKARYDQPVAALVDGSDACCDVPRKNSLQARLLYVCEHLSTHGCSY